MIKIRAALASDQDFIVHAQLAMAMETESLELHEETVRKGVAAVFASPQRGEYFVALQDDQLVAVLLTVPEWSDWRNGTVLWIHSVYVLPASRENGIFKKLYQHLHQMVIQSEGRFRGLRLYVDKRNLRAQKVYQKLGMSAEHYELYEWLSS